MSILLQYPNELLSKVSKKVLVVDDEIKALIEIMRNSLDSGIPGISAVQLGLLLRIIVVRNGSDILTIINPIITKQSPQMFKSIEGCLSIGRGKFGYIVPRHKQIKVLGVNADMKPMVYKGRDAFGRVLQHEIDHLDGILINQKGISING